MEKYFLAMLHGEDVNFREIEGETVTFEGFEEFYFFIHRSPEIYFLNVDVRKWVVSEASTGLAIGSGPDQEHAKVMTRKKIYAAGLDAFREKVNENIAKVGRSPWRAYTIGPK